ncbi:helix-turn-helix domain-containing protein [Chitinibacter sp. S2-10]|uniref:helix-turn-helix domain-containing protein n=1 Tax=Chitinibacter sp. S2-10 TaxID=3373597 RepID=UPI003977C7DC
MNEQEQKLTQRIGKAIGSHRRRMKMTQDAVAAKLDVTTESVSRMERGVVTMSMTRLAQLAELFQCDPADLLLESSARPSEQARHLAELLNELNDQDRELVVELTTRLIKGLRER